MKGFFSLETKTLSPYGERVFLWSPSSQTALLGEGKFYNYVLGTDREFAECCELAENNVGGCFFGVRVVFIEDKHSRPAA